MPRIAQLGQDITHGAANRVEGLFGATDKLRPLLDDVHDLPEIVILRIRNMTALDAPGLRALEDLAQALKTSGRSSRCW